MKNNDDLSGTSLEFPSGNNAQPDVWPCATCLTGSCLTCVTSCQAGCYSGSANWCSPNCNAFEALTFDGH
jgi:hypothetical protein